MEKIYFQFLVCLLFLVAFRGFSQAPTGEIQDAEIIIKKEKELQLPIFNRKILPSQTTIPKTPIRQLNFRYNIPAVDLPAFMPELAVYTLEKPAPVTLYSHHLTLGFGNYLSPLLDYQFSRQLPNKQQTGAYVRHESFNRGPVRDNLSGTTENKIGLWYEIQGEKISLKADAGYLRLGNYYYGVSDSLFNLFQDSLITEPLISDQVYTSFEFKNKPGKNKLNYRVNLGSAHTRQYVQGESALNRESLIFIKAAIDQAINQKTSFNIGIDTDVIPFENAISNNRQIAQLNGKFNYHMDNVSIWAGARGVFVNEPGLSRAYIMPDAGIKYRMIEQLNLYAVFGGSVNTNPLSNLININPLFSDSLSLKSSIEKINVKFGLTGNPLPALSYNAFISVSETDNALFFVNSIYDSTQFDAVFDQLSRLTISYALTYKPNDKQQYSVTVNHMNYRTDTLAEAWHLPRFSLNTQAQVLLLPNLTLSSSVLVLTGMKAQQASDQSVVEIPALVDFSSRLTYSLKQRHQVFFHVNNMLSRENVRFLNYPNRGIMFKGGISLQF